MPLTADNDAVAKYAEYTCHSTKQWSVLVADSVHKSATSLSCKIHVCSRVSSHISVRN